MAKEARWKYWADQRTSRNQNWTENETDTLIKVWFKFLEVLRLHRRTGKIYEKMADEFAQCGFKRTAIELQKKVSNLTQEYRKEKARENKGLGPSKWKFFDSVEKIISQLSTSQSPSLPISNPHSRLLCSRYPDAALSLATKSKTSESDTDKDDHTMDEVKFMTVYINEHSMSEDEAPNPEPQSQMPVIVSVESQHPDQNTLPDNKKRVLQNLKADMQQRVMEQSQSNQPMQRTLLLHPNLQQTANKNVLQDLKTDMHRVLEESLGIHRQQVTLQKRQMVLHEDMLKIMAKFIDNCP